MQQNKMLSSAPLIIKQLVKYKNSRILRFFCGYTALTNSSVIKATYLNVFIIFSIKISWCLLVIRLSSASKSLNLWGP